MDYIEAVSVVDHNKSDDKLADAQKVFAQKIQDADTEDVEAKGTYYYYLLKSTLEGHLIFETPICVSYYEEMHKYFTAQYEKYREEVHAEKSLPRKKRSHLKHMQLKAFFKLMERYYSSLENLYRQKNFYEARRRAYIDKMIFRKGYFRFTKDYPDFLIYWFFEKTSHFGESFVRWALTMLIFVLSFSIIIGLIDELQTGGQMIAVRGYQLYDYLYFSFVSFLTVGYGDIIPLTGIEKIMTTIFVIFGYIMLGMFINLIQKKL